MSNLEPSAHIPHVAAPYIYADTLGAGVVRMENYELNRELNAGQLDHDFGRIGQILVQARGSGDFSSDDSAREGTGQASSFGLEEIISFASQVKNSAVRHAQMSLNKGNWYDTTGEERLQKVRNQLRSLSASQREIAEVYFETGNPSLFASQTAAASRQNTPWLDWLSATNPDGSTDPRADAALTTFLHWHVSVIEDLQTSPVVADAIGEVKEAYVPGVIRGVEEDWLSEQAVATVPTVVDHTQVMIADPFVPEFRDPRIMGFAPWNASHVAIKQLTVPSLWRERFMVEMIRMVLPHELGHTALATNISPEEHEHWTFAEAYTEHTTLVQTDGRPDIVNPLLREGQSGTYHHVRILHAEFLNGPEGEVPPHVATKAFSGSLAEKTEYVDRVDHIWGLRGWLGYRYKRIDNDVDEYLGKNPQATFSEASDYAVQAAINDVSKMRENRLLRQRRWDVK